MRFPSGVVDQYLYFVAVDSTDYVTRETGLSSFTVYRARNGAAAAAYTTPTVAEVSSANMPGVYSLLLDEDMTIGSGNDSEEVVLHITQASMAPVTIKFELYRNVVTAGETLTVASGIGDADVEKWLGQTVAAVTVNGVPEVDVTHWRGTAAAAPTTAGVPAVEVIDIAAAGQTDVRAAVGLASANLDTQLSTIDDFLDTEVAAILAAVDTEVAAIVTATTAANIRAAVGIATANLDTQIATLATAAALTTVDDFLDTEIAAIKAKTDNIPAAPAAVGDIPTAAVIADAVWDEDATAHQTQGTFGQAIGDPALDADSIWALVNTNLDAAVSTRLASASYTAPLDAAGTRTAVGLASANLDTQLADLPTNAELATALGTADDAVLTQVALVKAKTDLIPASPAATGDIPTADITAIKAKTDSLTFTLAGKVDANIEAVNGAAITGTGSTADPWGP